MSNAREIREPLAWTVIVVSVGFLVAFVVRVVKMLTHDHSGLFGMARSLSGSSLGIGMILLLLAAVLVCRFIHPVTPHAELLGKVSAGVVAVAAGCDLVLALLSPIHGPGGAFGAVLGLFGDLLAIAIKVLAAWVLLVLTRPEAASVPDDEDPADSEAVQDGSADRSVVADEPKAQLTAMKLVGLPGSAQCGRGPGMLRVVQGHHRGIRMMRAAAGRRSVGPSRDEPDGQA
ncbi:hypothetical protein JCM18916_3341 [Cutibacterium acnes JCM 18916]|nr:hypothetical protein JCM18916_3341 [Cutibacterium acnes JCM 18916]